MIRKITFYILFIGLVLSVQAQTYDNGQTYNTFSSRGFMKFNRFLTVPTFSALRENKTSLTAIVRNSNIEFDDNPRVYLLSYSGKMRENVGAGFAVYQQEVGSLKDFGAIANYAHRLQLNETMDLTFGFNFLYSRSSLDRARVLVTNEDDSFLGNFQDIPVVMLQPAVTVSFGKFDVGVFFENLIDFDLKKSEMATSFGEKIYSAHAMYTHEFTYASGLFEGADLRFLGIARKPGKESFGYAANVIFDLPKAGWVKAGYDKDFGISAGVGVNISEELSIGFSYEKSSFAATNEVGITYNFGKKAFTRRRPTRRPGNVNVSLPERRPEPKNEYKNPEHNDLSDEIQKAQDSIDILNKKVDEVLRLLKNQPLPKNTTTIIQQPAEEKEAEEKDTSLRRRSDTPWRQSYVERSGGGGTMYYIVLDQFKNKENMETLLDKFKNTKAEVKYVYEPQRKTYYVYLDRFAKEEDADDMLEDFNDTTRQFENQDKDDLALQVKKVVKDPVYKLKITLGGELDTYKEPKTQPPARVRTLSKTDGIEPGYYLQVYVNSLKSLADRNVDELRNDDIDAGYFINPATGYYHVYILKTDTREKAIEMYDSNLNGAFYDRKSIIHIK